MNATEFKQALLQERRDLLELAETIDEQAAVVELDQSKVGRLSRMDAIQAQAMAQAQIRRRAVRLREIDAAVLRIDEDEFGFCQDCDQQINPKRLEVDPAVRFCIDCADKHEG